MSHYVVLVVGENIDEQLAPFNEQPEDESPYLEFNDCTKEVLEGWEEDTTQEWFAKTNTSLNQEDYFALEESKNGDIVVIVTEFFCLLKEGEIGAARLKNDYKSEMIYFKALSNPIPFEDDKKAKRNKHRVTKIEPPKEMPVKEKFKDIDEYAKDYHGFITKSKYNGKKLEEKKYGYFHNPHAKWDWYQVGGRWAGYLKLKEGSNGDLGEFSWGWSAEEKKKVTEEGHWASIAKKKDIDVEGLEAPLRKSAEEAWDGWNKEGIGEKFNALERDKDGRLIEEMPKDVREFIDTHFGFLVTKHEIEQLNTMSREEYVACQSIWSPYALLWDGKWYARGEMGWWGISTENDHQWHGAFRELWKDIPDDETITVVDCHI